MRSIEAPGGMICVDLYRRPDGSWGYAEYRRDPEDSRGWYPTGVEAEGFAMEGEAEQSARAEVAWMAL